jgi:hypothetical protein
MPICEAASDEVRALGRWAHGGHLNPLFPVTARKGAYTMKPNAKRTMPRLWGQ